MFSSFNSISIYNELRTSPKKTTRERPVHIVIGAGPSGVILAKRLIDDGDDVILIDQGSRHTSKKKRKTNSNSINWTSVAFSSINNNDDDGNDSKHITTYPQKGLGNRSIKIPQGHGIGGTTNINGMIFTAGHYSVYDNHWPSSWNSTKIKGYLETVMNIVKPEVISASDIPAAILKSKETNSNIGKSEEPRILEDYGIQSKYYGLCRGDKRLQLYDILNNNSNNNTTNNNSDNFKKGNLRICMYWNVEKINFDDKKAVSVSSRCIFTGKSKTHVALNGGEIILCAGTLGTPKILINSLLKPVYSNDDNNNDGSSTHIGWKSSPVFIPGIGSNLQDHTTLPLISISNWSSPLTNKGKNYHPPNGVHGWVNLDKDGNVIGKESGAKPVAQLLYVDGRISPALLPDLMLPYYDDNSIYSTSIRPFLLKILLYLVTLSFFKWFCSNCSGFLVCCTHRRSKGSILLNPDNPLIDFAIDPQYHDNSEDEVVVKNGINTAKKLMSKSFNVSIFPFFFLSQSQSIRLFSTSYYHICGTCSMPSKSDPTRENVVDEELRVIGMTNLRIADASVIPEIPSGPITATIMTIGAAAAELIRKDSIVS